MPRLTSLSFVATIGRPQCSIVLAVEMHGRAVTVLPLQGKAGEARALLSHGEPPDKRSIGAGRKNQHERQPHKQGGRNLEM